MRIRSIALGICVGTLGLLNAHAGNLVVTTTADSGAGSLRDIIAAASNGDTIQFDAALNGQTITLTTAELVIDKNLTIDGPGASQLTVQRSTADGTPAFRIFSIPDAYTVTIQGLTISNGLAQGDSPENVGGGISSAGATLTVANTIVSGNSADVGGGISSDAHLVGSAELTIINSTVSGNSAVLQGGGVYSSGRGDVRVAFATATLEGSTISENSAPYGGGILSEGFLGTAILTINDSTISGNHADNWGGGIYNNGYLHPINFALVTLNNSTISGNSAAAGAGIFNDGASGLAILRIANSTISDNEAGFEQRRHS